VALAMAVRGTQLSGVIMRTNWGSEHAAAPVRQA